MLFDFANVLVFLAFGILFVFVSLVLSRVLAPRVPSLRKSQPYECGEPAVGTPWIRFNTRFYVVALIFLIFDAEIAFMYPCATLYRHWVQRGLGKVAFLEIGTFVGILIAGLVYVWKKGDLEWIRQVPSREKPDDLSTTESNRSPRIP